MDNVVAPKVELKARPFDLSDVRLLDGPFKDAQDRCAAYLHALDASRLLHMFHVNAGLPSSAEPLTEWERPDCELRGHTVGHYLSACAMLYASTGDEKIKAKADAMVAELAKCQAAIGSGYLSAFEEEHFDRVEASKPVWAPYYAIHKIYAGLLDMALHCDNAQALAVARGMADWAKARTDKLDDEHMTRMIETTEQGGMNEMLANLYAMTGDEQYLTLARRFDQPSYVEPLARGEDKLKGKHGNSMIPNIVGSAREYELTGDEALADLSRFFWDTVVGGRTFATGGTTNFEHWRTEWGKLASELGPESQETCCTYNMLKLTKHLFTWRSDVKYADYYERAVLNGILASQDPTTGMMMYYGALKGGHWKIFNEHGKCFWCCTGTGFENHVKYGEAIYFHDDDSLTVNLFIASQLTWADKGLVVRQETNFPEQEGTNLMFSCEKPVELALHVRVPYWAVNGVIVKINGIEQDLKAQRGSYLVVERAWADGDCVAISMPMSLHLHRMPDDPNVAAIMYGPVVLAGRLGSDGLDREMIYIVDQRAMNHADDWPVPHFIVDTDDLNAWIKPVPGEGLMFHTAGAGDPTDVMLVPLYKITGERQSVYWTISTAEQWAARCAAAAERRRRIAEDRAAFVETVLDSVIIGDGASEAAHNMQTEGSETGTREGRSWREARGGQTFSYDMSIAARPKGKPIAVKCTYWGGDTGRIFHVTVGAWKIGMVTLNNERPGEFFEAEYRIPEFLLGEETLTIGFRAHAGNIAGAVYACRIATCWPGPEDDLQPYDD